MDDFLDYLEDDFGPDALRGFDTRDESDDFDTEAEFAAALGYAPETD